MAKKRRIKKRGVGASKVPEGPRAQADSDLTDAPLEGDTDLANKGVDRFEPLTVAAAVLGGGLVYVSYHPSDSVAVEKGDALWFGVIAFALFTVTISRWMWLRASAAQASTRLPEQEQDSIADATDVDLDVEDVVRTDNHWKHLSIAIDIAAWSLAGWVMLAAFATSPPGNLRMATNEAWLWISGAAVFSASRRLTAALQTRQAMLALMVVCAVGLALHGMHQQWISLPQTRAQYRENPERMLQTIGLSAPKGSAERMVFENRLFDGGPTGTFALANSLAAVLLIGAVLIVGVLRTQWTEMCKRDRIAWLIALAACLICLWAARSRSATAATVFGMVGMFVGVSLAKSNHTSRSKLRSLAMGTAALFIAGLGVVSLIGAVGQKEWFEQAPASISFRFQYWRSTLQLAFDRPLFGAGPGNFQSIYERYREASANEQISEPHNLIFETLGTGGFVGLILLFVLFALCAWFAYKRRLSGNRQVDAESIELPTAKWVWLGSVCALGLVWLIGAAAAQTPDFEAHMFVVPVVLGLAFLLWPAARRCPSWSIDLIAVVTLAALFVHLMAAGGWTVPGVAMFIWLLGGLISRVDTIPASINRVEHAPTSNQQPWRASLVSIVAGLILIFALRAMSIGPVEETKNALRAAEYAQSTGKRTALAKALQRAVDADSWAPDGCLLQADVLRWQLIATDSAELRSRWQAQLDAALDRAGDDPTIYLAAAKQTLHLYQRWGNPTDLQRADELLSQAYLWSPSNQWLAAQLAEIAAKRGDRSGAMTLSQRAGYLAGLGNNIERDLSRQLILPASVLGTNVGRGPKMAPASEILSEFLDSP